MLSSATLLWLVLVVPGYVIARISRLDSAAALALAPALTYGYAAVSVTLLDRLLIPVTLQALAVCWLIAVMVVIAWASIGWTPAKIELAAELATLGWATAAGIGATLVMVMTAPSTLTWLGNSTQPVDTAFLTALQLLNPSPGLDQHLTASSAYIAAVWGACFTAVVGCVCCYTRSSSIVSVVCASIAPVGMVASVAEMSVWLSHPGIPIVLVVLAALLTATVYPQAWVFSGVAVGAAATILPASFAACVVGSVIVWLTHLVVARPRSLADTATRVALLGAHVGIAALIAPHHSVSVSVHAPWADIYPGWTQQPSLMNWALLGSVLACLLAGYAFSRQRDNTAILTLLAAAGATVAVILAVRFHYLNVTVGITVMLTGLLWCSVIGVGVALAVALQPAVNYRNSSAASSSSRRQRISRIISSIAVLVCVVAASAATYAATTTSGSRLYAGTHLADEIVHVWKIAAQQQGTILVSPGHISPQMTAAAPGRVIVADQALIEGINRYGYDPVITSLMPAEVTTLVVLEHPQPSAVRTGLQGLAFNANMTRLHSSLAGTIYQIRAVTGTGIRALPAGIPDVFTSSGG